MLDQIVLREIFRVQYKLSLDKIQLIMAFVNTPSNFKILYGVLCDIVRIPFIKSFALAPRRGWILIFSTIQLACLLTVGLSDFKSYKVLMWLYWINYLCVSFNNVVIDGITCVQQRKDPKFGAADLQTFSWVSWTLSTILAASVGGAMVEADCSRYAFLMYAVVVLLSMSATFTMSIDMEVKKQPA